MEAFPRQAAAFIDPKLLLRVAKGEREAFAQLYDESNLLLFTLAHRILGDRDEAAHLLHEVYLEVWRRVARYDVSRGTPVAWLVALTRSRAIERLRARSACEPQTSSHLRPPVLPERQNLNTFDAMETSDWRETIARAITELPSAQRDAVEKAYYQGLSYTDIATKLDQPLGTIKTRIKLALGKLRNCLHTMAGQSFS